MGEVDVWGVLILVIFCKLFDLEIENYLCCEFVYNCVGFVKFEGLGIVLLSSMMGEDFNVLVGLLLIVLCDMLCY